MVADGMGGAAAGEVASAMATEVVLQELESRWRAAASDTDRESFARAIKGAAETANARIHRYASEHPENRGMGTTATIAGFLGDTLYLAQVGDSRAYLVRDGVAQQITKDQSLMQKLVEAGELTAEEAEVSERRNIILQALGPESVVKVDLTHQQVRRGDVLVLCSDGLSGQIRAPDIARIVSENPDLVAACKAMIDLANENGGPDNITVIAVLFDGDGLDVPRGRGRRRPYQAYAGRTEQRVTMPVNAAALQALGTEELALGVGEPRRWPKRHVPSRRARHPQRRRRRHNHFSSHASRSRLSAWSSAPSRSRSARSPSTGSSGSNADRAPHHQRIARWPARALRQIGGFHGPPRRQRPPVPSGARPRCVREARGTPRARPDRNHPRPRQHERHVRERRTHPGLARVARGRHDLLAFGREGPAAEFHVVKDAAAPATPAAKAPVASGKAPAAPAAAAGAARPARPAPPRRDTVARIADAVEERTSALRKMVIALGVLVVLGAGGAYWYVSREAAQAQARVDELLRRNDSLSAMFEKTVSSMRGRVAGLDSALSASRSETDQIRSRIQGEISKGGKANVEDLTARLDKAEQRQRALVSAGNVDYESIAAKDGPAIVFIAVQEADDSLMSGSGFNVAPSGLIVTNRHVVQDVQGRAAKRVKVIFEGTHGAWKSAHVVKISATDELAFIKIDDAGTYPVVAGVAKETSVRVGAPVALMGYPLGTSTAGMGGDINKLSPKSTLGLGTVSKLLADTLQFDAYAAPGSSGSAVFDARGLVVGVLFGGQQESNGRIVYAVPSAKLAAQLPPEANAIIR